MIDIEKVEFLIVKLEFFDVLFLVKYVYIQYIYVKIYMYLVYNLIFDIKCKLYIIKMGGFRYFLWEGVIFQI